MFESILTPEGMEAWLFDLTHGRVELAVAIRRIQVHETALRKALAEAQTAGRNRAGIMTPEPVAESLKRRFADWIDKRTEKGIAKYGHPLSTFNGRDAGMDAMQELLDFCQYQEQSRLELLDRIRELEAGTSDG